MPQTTLEKLFDILIQPRRNLGTNKSTISLLQAALALQRVVNPDRYQHASFDRRLQSQVQWKLCGNILLEAVSFPVKTCHVIGLFLGQQRLLV